jgi:hypothetical protein
MLDKKIPSHKRQQQQTAMIGGVWEGMANIGQKKGASNARAQLTPKNQML